MIIINCEPGDLASILKLYEAARVLQTERKMVVWPVFENSLMEQEILEKRQWKLMIENEMACNWATTFSDKDIWGEKDQNDSIFIHRIATDPAFRGRRFVKSIVDWARHYAKQNGKKYVRLDTLGNNTKLIQHYTEAGFDFLGIVRLSDVSKLPLHYHREPDCLLFELEA